METNGKGWGRGYSYCSHFIVNKVQPLADENSSEKAGWVDSVLHDYSSNAGIAKCELNTANCKIPGDHALLNFQFSILGGLVFQLSVADSSARSSPGLWPPPGCVFANRA